MADKIQIRAGNKSGMPTLTDREPAYVRDEKALYIGTPDGNVKIGGELETKVNTLQNKVNALEVKANALELVVEGHDDDIDDLKVDMPKKLTASPVASQAAVAAGADLATAVAALNALIAAMKSSGVMNT